MTAARVNPLWAWPVAAAIIIGAGAVVAIKPPEQMVQGPFFVNVALDERGTGRNIQATFHSVALADTVALDSVDGWVGDTEGVWVAADVTASSLVGRGSVRAFLLIGDYEFRGSERMDGDGLESWTLTPGIPARGTVLFEVPRALLDTATSARLVIGTNSDWRLDSVIATTVDLTALDTQEELTLPPASWEAP